MNDALSTFTHAAHAHWRTLSIERVTEAVAQLAASGLRPHQVTRCVLQDGVWVAPRHPREAAPRATAAPTTTTGGAAW